VSHREQKRSTITIKRFAGSDSSTSSRGSVPTSHSENGRGGKRGVRNRGEGGAFPSYYRIDPFASRFSGARTWDSAWTRDPILDAVCCSRSRVIATRCWIMAPGGATRRGRESRIRANLDITRRAISTISKSALGRFGHNTNSAADTRHRSQFEQTNGAICISMKRNHAAAARERKKKEKEEKKRNTRLPASL